MRPRSAAGRELAAGERRRARRRPSVPLVVLVVGLAYFVWVALLGSNVIALRGLEPTVTLEDWVLWGAGLMVVLLAVLLLHHVRTRRAPPARAAPADEAGWAASYAPESPDEILATADLWEGRRVLEYSRPPKSRLPKAVYAKVVVPVDERYALRVEDLVATERE